MEALLLTTLLVSGIAGAIALVLPWLVLVGAMILVLPGILLGVQPTLFLWTATFAGFYWALKPIAPPPAASALALIATVALLVLIPRLANRPLEARIAALRSDDRDAPGLRLGGIIRVENSAYTTFRADKVAQGSRRAAERHLVQCDALCLALLFTPEVASVIAAPLAAPGRKAPPDSTEAALYWIEEDDGAAPYVPWYRNGTTYGFKDFEALADGWQARLAADGRRIRASDPVEADFTIVLTSWRENEQPGSTTWSLTRPRLAIRRIEIRDRQGATVFRQTEVRGRRLSPVLWLTPEGDMTDFRFGWARAAPREPLGAFETAPMLARFLALPLAGDPDQAGAEARRSLPALLADPGKILGDKAYLLAERFFTIIAKEGPRPGDLALIEALVADRRILRGLGFFQAAQRLGPDVAALREPIARRILAAAPTGDEFAETLGHGLWLMPEMAFATLLPEEEAILAEAVRRPLARGLIRRLGDAGSAAVPTLLRIIEDGYRRAADETSRPRKQANAAEAARQALAALGPRAAGALPEVEAMMADGRVPAHVAAQENWALLLARLGRPVGSLAVPDAYAKRPDKYQARLNALLGRYNPAQF